MASILFAWEIGQNYGHTLPLLPVAKALRDRGHEVLFVVKELRQVSAHLRAAGFKVLQGPFHPDPFLRPQDAQPQSMSQILWHVGYDDPDQLNAYVSAWRDVMKLAGADLVVGSFAPTALLAARTLGLRTCLVGMPFEVPPPVVPSPALRPWLNIPAQSLAASDAALVRNVNTVTSPHGIRLEAAYEVFGSDRQLLWTFPEIDYEKHRRGAPNAPEPEYTGAIFTEELGGIPEWPESPSPRVFGYLRYPLQRMNELCRALGSSDASYCIVNPTLQEHEAKSLRSHNVVVMTAPVRLKDALRQCIAVLTYGGHGTICASLLQGRPLVLVPEQMDSVLVAIGVAKQQLALMPNVKSPGAVADACSRIVGSNPHLSAAAAFKRRHSSFDLASQADRLASSIETALCA